MNMHHDNDLLAELSTWTGKHPALDTSRVKSVFYFITPLTDKESVVLKSTYFQNIIWFFGVDDLFDSGDFTLEELHSAKDFLLEDRPLPASLEAIESKRMIIHDLKDTMNELLLSPSLGLYENKRFYQYLLDLRNEAINAMLIEASRDEGIEPDQYLETGKSSLGTSFIHVLIFYLMDKTFFVSGNYTQLEALLDVSAEAIRLLNDKRSFDRELQENKLNYIALIQQRKPSIGGFAEALKLVDSKIEQCILKLKHLVNSSRDQTLKRFGHFLMAVAEATQSFYEKQDFK